MGNNRNIRTRRGFKQTNRAGIQRIKDAQKKLFARAGPTLERYLLRAKTDNPTHVKDIKTLLDRTNKFNPFHGSTSKAKTFLRNVN